MSSTTDRQSERGQILVIFGVSLLVIFALAALIYDGGLMLLEKRTEQNAGDAAALAGARFLPDDPVAAAAAAYAVATANGFDDGVDGRTVTVHIPPVSGPHTGSDDHIEVVITSAEDSLFAGIWGIAKLNVAARAVAANHTGVDARFAMLSLDPSGCGAVTVEGQGELISNGNIHVNSTCTPNALHLSGQGEIVTAPTVACNVTGEFFASGSANYNCTVNESIQAIPDPLAGRAEPEIPTDGSGNIVYPTPPLQLPGGTTKPIPPGCPGGASAATEIAPASCHFPGSYAGTTWRLYPGYYPGGINLERGTFYMEPGVYYVAGGFDPGGGVGVVSFRIAGGGASVTSVDPGGTTLGGGIMIWNGEHQADGIPDPGLPDAPGIADGMVVLQGGNAGVNLWPLNDGSVWAKTVLAQDREVCKDVMIVGGSSNMEVRGVIYVPGLPLPGPPLCADGPEGSDSPRVIAEGNGGTVVTDQIIAFRFQMRGNIGSLTVAFDDSFLPEITTAGLVE